MTARRSELRIEYLPGSTGGGGGAAPEAAPELVPYVEGVSVEDRSHGRADGATLALSDADGRFSGRAAEGVPHWPISEGDRFRLSLLLVDWDAPGTSLLLPWGTFEADEVEHAGGSGGSTCTVRLQSASVLGSALGFRSTPRSEALGATTLQAAVVAACDRHGLGLSFLAADMPLARGLEQRAQPDAAFLRGLCERAGYHLAVREASAGISVVVSDEAALASGEAYRLTPEAARSWSFSRAVHGRFRAATCTYFDPRKGEAVEATVKGAGYTESSETLRVQAVVASEAEARRIARAALRRENRAGVSARLSLSPGRPEATAGSVVECVGFGSDDGRYLVDVARHRWRASGGFTTDLDLVGLP